MLRAWLFLSQGGQIGYVFKNGLLESCFPPCHCCSLRMRFRHSLMTCPDSLNIDKIFVAVHHFVVEFVCLMLLLLSLWE